MSAPAQLWETPGMIERIHPNFTAFRQFCGTGGDECGPNMITTIAASLRPNLYQADCTSQNAIVSAMASRGLDGHNTTMSENVQQLRDMGFEADYADWEHWHPELRLDLLHAVLAGARYDQGDMVGIQFGNAQAIPNNQQGVHSHYCACGGVSTTRGYLIADGDIPSIHFHGNEWVPWSDIVAAVPTAVCVVRNPAPKLSPLAQKLHDAGWHDSKDFTATAFDGILYAPNGHSFERGNRQHLLSLADYDVSAVPVMQEATDGTVSAQVTTQAEWAWSQQTGVVVRPLSPVGTVLAFVWQVLQRAPKQLAPAAQVEALGQDTIQRVIDAIRTSGRVPQAELVIPLARDTPLQQGEDNGTSGN